MKKRVLTAALSLVMLVAFAAMFTGCGADLSDHDLVGTWEWVEAPMYRVVFNGDGTGDRGVPGVELQTFTWSVSGSDRLNINLDENPGGDYIRNERWTWTIDGDTLTIDSRQTDDIWVYTRAN